jgi:hypothetical protein
MKAKLPISPAKEAKLLLQGIFQKKEEFDEDGRALRHSPWEQYTVTLNGMKLQLKRSDEVVAKKRSFKERMLTPLTKSIADLKIISKDALQKTHTRSDADLLVRDNTVPLELSDVDSRSLLDLTDASQDSGLPELPKIKKTHHGHTQSYSDLLSSDDDVGNKETAITEGLSKDLFEELFDGAVETIKLNNLCRITSVANSGKKEATIRVMLENQRSFLLKTKAAHEMELWLQAMKMAIDMVSFV